MTVRLRSLLGVAVGVFLGDLITHVLGSGGWQIALIVSLAMSTALLLDAGQIFVTQAAVQSIVVATLVPDPGAAFTRWTDALIGGAIALVALTRVFVFAAPRVFGTNLVYGTLGAILIGLTWLDLVFTVVLLGAAWVRERATSVEAAVA